MMPSTSTYDELWKMIIEPERMVYTIQNLGPKEFNIKDKPIRRKDFKIQNGRGLFLECSFFEHMTPNEQKGPRPCVIYCHGSGCSRLEGLRYYNVALANNFNFFCFDFAGSGMSDGRYTSIGWFEQHDIECVVEYLLQNNKASRIALWGRSMGAVASIFYSARMPRIDCLILDSPYSKFNRFAKELVAREASSVPGFITKGALSLLRSTVMDIADFDLDDLVPIDYVPAISAPILFGHGQDDDLIAAEQCYDLYNAAEGLKEMIIFQGDHNSERPEKFHRTVADFLIRHLGKARPQPKLLKVPLPQPNMMMPRKHSLGAVRQPIQHMRNVQSPPIMINGAEPRTRKLANPGFTSSVFNGPPPLVQPINGFPVRHNSANPMMMSQQISQRGPAPMILKTEHHPNYTTRFLTPPPQHHIQQQPQPLLIPTHPIREVPRMVINPIPQQVPQMRVQTLPAPSPLIGFTSVNMAPINIPSSSFPASMNQLIVNPPLQELRSSRTRFYSHDVVYHM